MIDLSSLPQNCFGAIYADPPWLFKTYSDKGRDRSPDYTLMNWADMAAMEVCKLTKPDCVLFMWVTWPMLIPAIKLIDAWQFEYKTCAFSWMKADVSTINMFDGPRDADMGLGYWTRSNSEVCLLATRGKPKRKDAGVRQGIIEPRREHSRKPTCVYERIERLVDGPYLELFARTQRPKWTSWGNQVDKFKCLEGIANA